MDLGSSLGTPSVSQRSIKRSFDKSKTGRQFLCCPKNFFLSVLSAFLLLVCYLILLSDCTAFFSPLSNTALLSRTSVSGSGGRLCVGNDH